MACGLQSAVRSGAGGDDREANRCGTMMNSGHLANGPEGYGAIREGAAWARLPERTVLTASGSDAVRFLDGFTTAAVSRLACGGGTEGFLADARGWVIALVDLVREEDGVRLEAGPGLGHRLLTHLEHFHIREDVSLVDVSPARTTFVVVGPETPAWLERHVGVAMPEHVLDHHPAVVADGAAAIVRTDWYGMPGVRIQVASDVGERTAAWLATTGLPLASTAAIDTARIEAGNPEPHDIPDKTLPQELDRDARAISFTKGCYLGQETVARIDALGHANRRLVALACRDPLPGAGVMLEAESIGTVTSACRSPRLEHGLALAIIHVRGLAAGARLTVSGSDARVVPFPARLGGGSQA